MRILKTYESFREPFKFEENVIDPILSIIRDHQEYLTQPDNLPQLAKLGYMYNTLWYNGRICWGDDGILHDKKMLKKLREKEDEDGDTDYWSFISCEENPKYKIEMCNPQNEEIENLIYDAWAMHVREREDKMSHPTATQFMNTILGSRKLTELEQKQLKKNKTFDDWVEIMTDDNYRYKSLFPDRKSVASHLLCTIGGGYGWNRDGFIVEQSGGADQDRAGYGDWENAKFTGEIKAEVDRILAIPQLSETLDAAHVYIEDLKEKDRKKKEDEENKWKSKIIAAVKSKLPEDNTTEDDIDDSWMEELLAGLKSKARDLRAGSSKESTQQKYRQYYPISSSSNIYAILSDEKRQRLGIQKFDQSYVDEAINIAQEIMQNEKLERPENVEFATKLLAKFNIGDWASKVTKEVDKYELLEEIEDVFLYLTDRLNKQTTPNNYELKKDEYYLYLNDTKNSDYADNNYNFCMSLKGYNVPKGYDITIEPLKSTPIYSDLKSIISNLSKIPAIKVLQVYCNTVGSQYDPLTLEIKIIVNKPEYAKDIQEEDEMLKQQGFMVGSNSIALELKDYILKTSKPKPLGKSRPMNTSEGDYFSTNGQFEVLNKSWVKLFDGNIDERGFNIISIEGTSHKDIKDWVRSEFNKMKLSDPGYGTYGIKGKSNQNEGKKNLYRHRFFLWLKNNQM